MVEGLKIEAQSDRFVEFKRPEQSNLKEVSAETLVELAKSCPDSYYSEAKKHYPNEIIKGQDRAKSEWYIALKEELDGRIEEAKRNFQETMQVRAINDNDQEVVEKLMKLSGVLESWSPSSFSPTIQPGESPHGKYMPE